ncbi:MAG TPA: GNAT family N-acetyltransferase [Candidatus Limnocylindrales bacterium]|nr:GNAT family N-acetyltransferase [Candidatus Limnocylindrales bacterium]
MSDASRRVDVTDRPERGRYEARLDGELAGFLTYRRAGDAIVLVHTQVDPAFEGRGVGGGLAAFALEDARRSGSRVTPECPFVRSWLRRHREFSDLVDPASPASQPEDR